VAVTAPPLSVDPSSKPAEREARTELALTDETICARVDGRVHCGADPGAPLASLPVLFEGATAFSRGRSVACAVVGGRVLCSGSNTRGELGAHLRRDKSDEPVAVAGISSATGVFVGPSHACALGAAGLACWGRNDSGETGGAVAYTSDARELVAPTPVPIASPAVAALSSDATCAVTARREVYCWGRPVLGAQEKERGGSDERPWHAKELDGLEDISASGNVFCGVRAGEVLCWGESYDLFPGFRGRTAEPRAIHVPAARKVRVGAGHACALATDGRVFCWGAGWTHALGRDTGEDTSATFGPEALGVQSLPRAVDLAVGGSMACAITFGGEVYCWGKWPYAAGRPARVELTPVAVPVGE
jgi:hypothetical protein